jgi:hypothetical protein
MLILLMIPCDAIPLFHKLKNKLYIEIMNEKWK